MAPFGAAAGAALVAGILACLCLPELPPWPVLALAFALGLRGWIACRQWGRLAGIALLGIGLCGLHAARSLERQLPPPFERADVEVMGTVVDLPRHEPDRTAFRFRVDQGGSVPPHLRGRLLQLAWYDERGAGPDPARKGIEPGSRWRFTARLRAPRGLRNPGGSDSEKQALAYGVSADGYLRDTEAAVRLSPPAGIDAWRSRTSARIAATVPHEAARFVRALALGDTRALDLHDWEVLRSNGLTHLIAISGFHVGLVAGFFALLATGLWRLLPTLGRRFPRQHAAGVAAVVGACGYAAVAGFALPTVRTALMIGVILAARLARRAHGMADALGLAALVVGLVDPLALLTPGFWLSFGGVAWLLWCLPPGSERNPLHGLVSAQAVATLGLLPLTVVLFGQASLSGPVANLVAVPWWSLVVVPLALLGTALETLHAGAGAWAWQWAATAFGWSWPGFTWLHDSGLALWWLPEPAWYALPLALLAAFWMLLPRSVPGKQLACLLWLPLLLPSRQAPAVGAFELVMLDVGQGLSVVVRTARHALVYDMGPALPGGFDAGARVVVPALHAIGVRRVDAAVVSHGDNDHAGGWPSVRRAFPAPAYAPEGSPVPGEFACVAGHAWEWDGVRFRFLHPTPFFPYLGNEASCVLRIESPHGTALLTGDIGDVVERTILRADPEAVRADVVQVAHHGSRHSSDWDFVHATGATHALVAAGADSRFRHPAPLIVERWTGAGARVRSTAQGGALRVRVEQRGIRVLPRRAVDRRLWDAVWRRRGSPTP
ncbi:MAG TPA: DNA internalization-related competence protein ComEC/Rec2 [Xanthomonadaceae bacterium]|nr:DNA internalization-related competence protein ComEC/Rec2 [Xanthomonadaceae bacterium]